MIITYGFPAFFFFSFSCRIWVQKGWIPWCFPIKHSGVFPFLLIFPPLFPLFPLFHWHRTASRLSLRRRLPAASDSVDSWPNTPFSFFFSPSDRKSRISNLRIPCLSEGGFFILRRKVGSDLLSTSPPLLLLFFARLFEKNMFSIFATTCSQWFAQYRQQDPRPSFPLLLLPLPLPCIEGRA